MLLQQDAVTRGGSRMLDTKVMWQTGDELVGGWFESAYVRSGCGVHYVPSYPSSEKFWEEVGGYINVFDDVI